MKPFIVAPRDLADAFRLAGVRVFEISDRSEITQIVREIRALADVGLVLVDERYMEEFERAFAGAELPMLASYPAEEVAREETYIDELTRRYLGQKIYVEGE
ncbi:V-type ATP synthase subunit F [Candidatus Acetothermia bacterium]|jgi:vacuolar-type H+-ATPase subunit F/Vma7|nr:V-type ATP synthase subunit F [Candidatus Acetothermia bacterium]MCI2431041.1 V-type ATP synthase subunit F [Candidatus Acetothermia bacterium]MCI2436937.1 V-type ATP synthase subunit F [Candidatus Acetothermia bacterium]